MPGLYLYQRLHLLLSYVVFPLCGVASLTRHQVSETDTSYACACLRVHEDSSIAGCTPDVRSDAATLSRALSMRSRACDNGNN